MYHILGWVLMYIVPVFVFVYAWFFMENKENDDLTRGDVRGSSTLILSMILLGTGIYLLSN